MFSFPLTQCILTSFCYAEFASRIPVTGSAFVYAYVSFGEVWAWLVGWNLTLGYGFTASVVARAWGDYLGDFVRQSLRSMGATPGWVRVTELISALPLLGEDINYRCSPLSVIIVYATTLVLLRGVKDSSRFNNAMTILNISILILVILSGIFSNSVEVDNLQPFVPNGLSGVVGGAGLVFFAFIGMYIRCERRIPIVEYFHHSQPSRPLFFAIGFGEWKACLV